MTQQEQIQKRRKTEPEAETAKTDAEVHARRYQGDTDEAIHSRSSDCKMEHVAPGDEIVHYTSIKSPSGASCWFKAPQGVTLNPDRNILAVALEGFTYVAGKGMSYEMVKFRIKRRWIEPFRGPPLKGPDGRMMPGQVFPGGDMLMIDEQGRPDPVIQQLMDPPLPEGEVMRTKQADGVLSAA